MTDTPAPPAPITHTKEFGAAYDKARRSYGFVAALSRQWRYTRRDPDAPAVGRHGELVLAGSRLECGSPVVSGVWIRGAAESRTSIGAGSRPRICHRVDLLETGIRRDATCSRRHLGLEDVYLVDMGDVTDNGFAKVFMTIAAAFAELEREKTRERTLEVHAYRRSIGKHVAGRVPFGYSVTREGFLVEVPAQQKALTRMKRLRTAGKSYREIQADLKAKLKLSLSPFGIQRILTNKRRIPRTAR